MFSWDFTRSAEAMFSRWAIKRACKFLLKKRLGDFILGDIDLDQIDVQLSRGTIQLQDLALNVDFLNQKLAGAAVMVKEGSISSLLIKVPWKQNCEIEVEELELVLSPFAGRNSRKDADASDLGAGGGEGTRADMEKGELGGAPSSTNSTSPDFHEGVKVIAKFVKWILTSFHVRLKNVILAFDPCADGEERKPEFCRSLVLRIANAELGSCISENAASSPKSMCDGLQGLARLTNFMKFEGAVVEFLEMYDADKQTQVHADLGTSFSEWHTGSSALSGGTSVLTGAIDGFSGKVNISIPWKNGSLDLRKVDADVFVEPVRLRIHPSTLEWVIVVWESLKSVDTSARGHTSFMSDADSFFTTSKTYGQTSAEQCSDIDLLSRGSMSKSIYPATNKEPLPDSLPPRANVIHNWVPLSIREGDQAELETDYDSSIDQFFECFDEIRSSQMSSGNSGIWNWTCSVYSAITAASDLASGSGYTPIEQNVETSLRVTIEEVSVILSFHDEEQKASHDSLDRGKHMRGHGIYHGNLSGIFDGEDSGPYRNCMSSMDIEQLTEIEACSMNLEVNGLEASFQNAILNLQFSSQRTKFDAAVVHFKIDEFYDTRKSDMGSGSHNRNSCDQIILNEHLQGQVQKVLPPFPSVRKHDLETSVKENVSRTPGSTSAHDFKVNLLESIGECNFHYAFAPTGPNQRSVTSPSFSIQLPSFVIWVQFQTVDKLLNFFKEVESYFHKYSENKDFASDALHRKYISSSLDGVKSCVSAYTSPVSPSTNLQGNLVLQQARVVVCFPSEYHEERRCSSSLIKFVILEHTSLGKVSNACPVYETGFPKGSSFATFTSVHLNVGKLDMYLVNSADTDALGDSSYTPDKQSFSAVKLLSITSRTNDQSGITMVWQRGSVTGPWMARRAWSLSTSHEQRSRYKMTRKGCYFSSVSTAEDLEQTNSNIRQELILSSAFFLHARFSLVQLNVGSNSYKLLNHMINQAMNVISTEKQDLTTGADHIMKHLQSSSGVSDASQTSVLVECDALDLSITLEDLVEVSHSMQKELSGSWNCFKLTIEKLELLSVSDIGGINNAKYLWLNHGEGELWGSIFDKDEKDSPLTRDFLLITCRNSTIGRGAGGGANALSFGSAGTAITHLQNPQLLQSHTYIIVRCGTIVAPGGRLDWINAVQSFFSLPYANDQTINGGMQTSSSVDDPPCLSSLYLDLVDIALSYEPHMKIPAGSDHELDTEYSDFVECSQETDEQYVACLLAAASLRLSNHTIPNSSILDYNIQLQDVGLLIAEYSRTRNDHNGYNAGSLQKSGYKKVAEEALIEAIMRIEDLFWEVEFSDLHISLDTCHDTTYGLVRLIDQLQQLYATDLEDAWAHLQSRWNANQQAHSGDLPNEVTEISASSSVGVNSEKELLISKDDLSVGLLDGIIENAFHKNELREPPYDNCNFRSSLQEERVRCDNDYGLNVRTSISGNSIAQRVPLEGSMSNSAMPRNQVSSAHETCSPEIIESYYASKLSPPSNSNINNYLASDYPKAKLDYGALREIEYGKGGWYGDDSLKLVENHMSTIINQPEHQRLRPKGSVSSVNYEPVNDCRKKGRILLRNTDVRWRMYTGVDWSEPSQISVFSSDSNERDRSVCLELNLSGLGVQYDMYPDGEISVSKLLASVEHINLFDISESAPWRLVLGYYSSKDHPRESCSKAFKLELETVRPDPLIPLEECRLNLEFLPLILHLHQAQLDFLMNFFGKDSFDDGPPIIHNNLDGSGISERKKIFRNHAIVEEALLPFFQNCVVKPVVVRVDYVPRHIDLAALSKGNYMELLNLVPWKGIELQLKNVCAVGVYGWSSVCETVIGEWLEDISHNQVSKLLKGLAPVRSLFAVTSGTSKLVSLPVKSYKKDQKLLKGMQRGALAFIRSISLEAVGLGVHLAAGAHEILLQTECILARIPPSSLLSEESRARQIVRSNQPKDAPHGIQQAFESVSEGFGRSASALLGTPLKAYQHGAGAGSVIATAVRAVPAAAMAPMSASARAVHFALLGVRNSLDPEHKKESIEKYLGPSRW